METTTITTTLTAPGERAVKANGEYIGLIVNTGKGWKWMGGPATWRTFTKAAEYVARRKGLI